MTAATDGEAGALRALALVALALLALRILSLWFNNSPLFFDEAQYWAWGKEPAFGYFSKPPLIAWLIGATTAICGDSEFCIRLPSPLIHTLTGFVIFASGNLLFGRRTGLLAGVTWLTLPAVSLSSTLISTDVPLLFLWSTALYATIRLEREGGWLWAGILSVAIGLGLNAKYAMIYFVLCAIIYGLAVRGQPRLIANPRFWAGIAGGLVFLFPNLMWNAAHQFVTAGHTGENIGWTGSLFHPDRLAEFLGSQFGVMGPILFGIYLVALFRLWKEGASREQKFLIAFSLPVLVLISIQALLSKAYANWAATAYPAAVILVSHLLVTRVPAIWNRASLAIHGVVLAVISVAVAFAAPGQLPLASSANPFARMWGGKELAAAVSAELDKSAGYTHVLAMSRSNSASLIYELRDREQKVMAWRGEGPPRDHFEMSRAVQDMSEAGAADAVFLLVAGKGGIPDGVSSRFAAIEDLGEKVLVPETGQKVRLYRLEGYRP